VAAFERFIAPVCHPSVQDEESALSAQDLHDFISPFINFFIANKAFPSSAGEVPSERKEQARQRLRLGLKRPR